MLLATRRSRTADLGRLADEDLMELVHSGEAGAKKKMQGDHARMTKEDKTMQAEHKKMVKEHDRMREQHKKMLAGHPAK